MRMSFTLASPSCRANQARRPSRPSAGRRSQAPGRRAAFAYAGSAEAPRDPEEFLLSGEARLERVEARREPLEAR